MSDTVKLDPVTKVSPLSSLTRGIDGRLPERHLKDKKKETAEDNSDSDSKSNTESENEGLSDPEAKNSYNSDTTNEPESQNKTAHQDINGSKSTSNREKLPPHIDEIV